MPMPAGYLTFGDFILTAGAYDFKDKDQSIKTYAAYMLDKASQMLNIEDLPDTMPEKDIKRLLQTRGHIEVPDPEKFPQLNGKLYAFAGNLGNVNDVYYKPTSSVIANPALDISIEMKIGEEGVMISHDSYNMGLMRIINRYATLLVETDITTLCQLYLMRSPIIMLASTDNEAKSAREFLKKLIKGDLSAIVSNNKFAEGIRSLDMGHDSTVVPNLIEITQYLKGNGYNDIGLNAQFNMKRESLNAAETELNNDILQPLADDILKNVRSGFDEFNERYGQNVKVELNSAWLNRNRVVEAEVENIESGDEDPEESSSDAPDPEKPEPEKKEGEPDETD